MGRLTRIIPPVKHAASGRKKARYPMRKAGFLMVAGVGFEPTTFRL